MRTDPGNRASLAGLHSAGRPRVWGSSGGFPTAADPVKAVPSRRVGRSDELLCLPARSAQTPPAEARTSPHTRQHHRRDKGKENAMSGKTTAPTRRGTTWRAMLAGASALGALGIASPANAAAPAPFTLTDYVNNVTGVYTFTTTGPLCSSGTFVDDVKLGLFPVSDHANPTAGGNILIRTTLTCD